MALDLFTLPIKIYDTNIHMYVYIPMHVYTYKYIHIHIYGLGPHPVILLVLHSGITSINAWGQNGTPGTETRSTMCKSSASPFLSIISLAPKYLSYFNFN